MKTLIAVLSIFLITTFRAVAEELPLKLYIDVPKRTEEIVNINSDGILISINPARDEFPVRFTNTSTEPVWFWGYSPNFPLYSYFARTKGSNVWGTSRIGWCGNGVQAYIIYPGATIEFPISFQKEYIGQLIKVEFDVYELPVSSESITVSSEALLLQ